VELVQQKVHLVNLALVIDAHVSVMVRVVPVVDVRDVLIPSREIHGHPLINDGNRSNCK